MPKGKTNAPLNILVIESELYDSDEMQQLVNQGHKVGALMQAAGTPLGDYDRIYGKNCYRMTPDLLPFLSLSLKQARLEKKTRGTKAQ